MEKWYSDITNTIKPLRPVNVENKKDWLNVIVPEINIAQLLKNTLKYKAWGVDNISHVVCDADSIKNLVK